MLDQTSLGTIRGITERKFVLLTLLPAAHFCAIIVSNDLEVSDVKNNATKCVPVSPDEYIHLTDEEIDAKLLSIATKRMAHYDPNGAIPAEEVYRKLGINQEDIENCSDV